MTTPDSMLLPPLRLRASRLSDTGLVLKYNGDFAGYIEPVKPAMLEQSGCLYIVADGLGGTKQGERTSQYAVERVLTEYYQNPNLTPGVRLRHVINRISLEIADLASESSFSTMQSTLMAAVIKDNLLTIASVGSNRAYLIRDGSTQQVTRGHNEVSAVQPKGEVTVEDMLAAAKVNTLTRSLGSYNTLVIDIYENITLHPGDVLLLCTDGLIRYTSDSLLASMVRDRSPEMVCRSLVDYANAAGGEDNITVLVVMVEEDEVKNLAQPVMAAPTPPSLASGPVQAEVEVGDALPEVHYPLPPPSPAPIANPTTADEPTRRILASKEVFVLAAAVSVMLFVCLLLAFLLVLRF